MEPTTIIDAPVPLIDGTITAQSGQNSSPNTSDGTMPHTTSDIAIPSAILAQEVISQSINTQTKSILGQYSFESLGAIKISSLVNPLANIAISPNGIIATNSLGVTTITIDGTTGDVTLVGTLAAGSVIAGSVLANYIQVGGAAADVNSGSTTISGGKITTNSLDANTIKTSTLSVALNVGVAGVKIDGANKNIIINDGTNDRILIGFQSGGF